MGTDCQRKSIAQEGKGCKVRKDILCIVEGIEGHRMAGAPSEREFCVELGWISNRKGPAELCCLDRKLGFYC